MTLAKRESSITRVATGAAALVLFLMALSVFFGSLGEHHVAFSVGWDIRLPQAKAGPVNYVR